MSYRWMPIAGQFDFPDDSVVFKGQPAAPLPSGETGEPKLSVGSVGVCLSNRTMANGYISAAIEFAQSSPPAISCEILISYDVTTQAQISAGLGGGSSMFVIREWLVPAAGQTGTWKYHAQTGARANLQTGRKYEVHLRVEGSNVSLKVDDVPVCTTTLPAPLQQPRQVGIFCISTSNVTISGFGIRPERPRAFVVMQFSSPYDEVYSNVIKAVCDPLDVDPIRADEIYGPGIIIKDVVDRIQRSDVIIADISPQNPNVYFEVGYALALGKPIILLAQRREADNQLPFDVSAFRVLFYDDSIGGKPKLEEGLRRHLEEILGKSKAW